ncbi:MAG: thiamine biosynthesis protein [Desulfuromonadaceae bacterium]|nr:thiamine biosynthesis protein [Desulfuromonadaceae bacterium]
MAKSLGLFSGGLDSMLAALLLRRQGVEVTGIAFVTPFFGAEKAVKSAAALEIPLIVRDIAVEHLEMLKNPRYGYGRNLNPCIDCHALMFRLAAGVMTEGGFDFLFSGEVLGQRPMSQNLNALKAVAKASGTGARILRPLSARLLPVTAMEREGLVDRERLLDIQGRSRRRQEELARQWGVIDYPAPGGGCLLTEKSFINRLRELLESTPEADVTDMELLKLGRRFRLPPSAWLTVGRNQEHNEAIRGLARPTDWLIHARECAGPLGLVSGSASEENLLTAAAIVGGYGKGKNCQGLLVTVRRGEESRMVEVAPFSAEELASRILP